MDDIVSFGGGRMGTTIAHVLLDRGERTGRATAAVFALNDDPGNLFSAVLAKAHGAQLTIALAHDQTSPSTRGS